MVFCHLFCIFFFFFKQKTAYEMRISDWSSDVCSSDLPAIMQAIRDGAWDVYDLLAANKKTALNAININRETPLMYLAVVGETKRAQDLIRRGAMVNRLGWTPLQYAASDRKSVV